MPTGPDQMTTFDPDAVHAKYLAERDKRLIEGRAAIRDLRRDEYFSKFRADPFTPVVARDPVVEDVEVAIIGAGMAGVCAGVRIRQAGVQRIRMIDEAGGVGGTWYWNRYPGVMCDVESYIYIPMLEELDYVPRRRYAFGDEIRGHFEKLAEKYDLVEASLFHTRVDRSEWNPELGRWVIHTNRGDEIRAQYLVMAVGILNLMKLPAIPGMEEFRGRSFHSGRWDYEYTGGSQEHLPPVYGGTEDGKLSKLADKVVGVMGTGASAIQCIPPLAESAKHLFVFQRTPSAVGVRGNRPTSEEFIKDLQPGWQWARMLNFQAVMDAQAVDADLIDDGWTHHFGPTHHPVIEPGMSPADIMLRAEEFDFGVMEEHRGRIVETVTDPRVAEALKPYYRYLCKRPCFHDEYLPAFNLPNVTLVDCPGGVERVTPGGLIIDGHEYELDCLIYATGFEAETTPLSRRVGHDVIGRDGITLADKWDQGASSLFGMMTGGFPNLFIMPAPGQQAVVTVNHTLITVVGAEHIGATVKILRERGVAMVDVTEEAEADWCQKIVSKYRDPSAVMGACTPSRLNFEGNPGAMRPESGSYGGGLGDFWGFCELIADWRARLASGESVGLELREEPAPR
jgi:cation diffusion facilitator CzcD-associated flavoprotein CzcO